MRMEAVVPLPAVRHSAIVATEVHYRGYRITYDPKPVPARCGVDWSWVHDDYDGPGDPRCGASGSIEAAVADIDELEDERAEPTLSLRNVASAVALAVLFVALILVLPDVPQVPA